MITEIPADYWLRRQMSYDEFVSREWVRQDKKDEKSLIPFLKFFAFAAANKTLPKRAKKITYTTPEADVVNDCMTGLQELCRKIGIRVLFVQN